MQACPNCIKGPLSPPTAPLAFHCTLFACQPAYIMCAFAPPHQTLRSPTSSCPLSRTTSGCQMPTSAGWQRQQCTALLAASNMWHSEARVLAAAAAAAVVIALLGLRHQPLTTTSAAAIVAAVQTPWICSSSDSSRHLMGAGRLFSSCRQQLVMSLLPSAMLGSF